LLRAVAAARVQQQRLGAPCQSKFRYEGFIARHFSLAIESARPEKALHAGCALDEDVVQPIRRWQVLASIRQPRVALQQPRLAREEHALQHGSVTHIECLDIGRNACLPVCRGRANSPVRHACNVFRIVRDVGNNSYKYRRAKPSAATHVMGEQRKRDGAFARSSQA